MASFPFFPDFGNFRSPFSGEVNQRIITPWFSPSVNVTYAGSPAIEERVVSDVASYGRQLGWLNELVVALADKKAPPAGTLKKLRDAMAEIDAVKERVRKSAREEAEAALDRLTKEDPKGAEALMRSRLSGG